VAERSSRPLTAILALTVATGLLLSGCNLIDPGADSTPSGVTRDNKGVVRKGG
jgi:hypothetical protein